MFWQCNHEQGVFVFKNSHTSIDKTTIKTTNFLSKQELNKGSDSRHVDVEETSGELQEVRDTRKGEILSEKNSPVGYSTPKS